MSAAPGLTLTLTLTLTLHDASATRTVAVRDTGATIGRGAECDVVLADPRRAISRLQARIDWRDGHYRLTDAGRNPTLVNGHILGVSREAVLRDADTLSIDTYRIEIGIRGASSGDEPTVFAALPAGVADDDAAPHEDGFDPPTRVRVPGREAGEGAASVIGHATAQRAHEEAPRPDDDAFDVPTMGRMPDVDAGQVVGVRVAEAAHAADRADTAMRPARGAAHPAIGAPRDAALPSSVADDAVDAAGDVDVAATATATATDATDATAPRTPSPESTRHAAAGHAADATPNDALLSALQDGLGIVPTTLTPPDAIAFTHLAGVLLRESIEGAMAMHGRASGRATMPGDATPNRPTAPNPLLDATSVEAALTLLLASAHAEAARTMLRDAFAGMREHQRALHDVLREVLTDLAPVTAPPSRTGWLGRWLASRASRSRREQAWARAARRAAALLDVPAASLRAPQASRATDSRPRSP
ncbi:FHA domain-containing protein [Burkholderia plantarii]|uniref:FHA domain-containing protein n=1 Tax=Burkholderia plantarii TaxID=41899 RepID=UPI0006D88FCA|nr:FHA domain-containing protein [Burkholderia plantarii]ALK32588.1 type VI secretion system FHA domain protein [Burkholderia plantarii]GLZ19961.1 hypothetical protein Bpla01_34900 [Burkholderia plantarii]